MNSTQKEACKECGSVHIKILVRGEELDEFVAHCPICNEAVGVKMVPSSPILDTIRGWGTKEQQEFRAERESAGVGHMGATDLISAPKKEKGRAA